MSEFSTTQRMEILQIIKEYNQREGISGTWDGPGEEPAPPMPGQVTFTESGLNDGWSDQIHPSGGFWSEGVQEYRRELSFGLPGLANGLRRNALLMHPFLNCAWITYFSPARKDYAKSLDRDAAMQGEVNLFHYGFALNTIPGGGNRPQSNSNFDQTLTLPQALQWKIQYNDSGRYAGANPIGDFEDSLVFVIDGTSDAALARAIRQFGESFLREGPLSDSFVLPRPPSV